ncbi:MAG: DegV family protein [Clostridia bacterium]|nr:DegV family protein [Clostridia bacterium]
MKLAVLVDSTAVADSLKAKYDNLYSVPLKIIFQEDTYADGIDLTQESFFEKLERTETLPTTSQPSIGEVETLFKDLLNNYDHVIYLTLSSKISGTYDSGLMARQIVSEERITVFDTLNASIIHKIMTEEVLKMHGEGKEITDIVKRLEVLREHATIHLVVDDLKHLSRTGRLSSTSASIGNMLQIKPILHFVDGKIELLKKVRSIKKAHQSLIDTVASRNLQPGDYVSIAHAHGMAYAEPLKNELEKLYPELNITINDLSPVISVHTGPKTIGIGWIKL